MKKRIWELDVFRGICILGMVIVHLLYDLVELYHMIDWEYPPIFLFVRDWGSILFLLISGICVTLGSHPIRRGLMVFGGGLLVSAVTIGMVILDFAGTDMIIWFGILHCLGVCMLLWPLFRKLHPVFLLLLGVAMVATGLYLNVYVRVSFPWLIPFGILHPEFASSDYFPLLPNLGFFLLGCFLGKTLYRGKESLFPRVNDKNPLIVFLSGCGKHSLWIYLLHQPVITGLLTLISLL